LNTEGELFFTWPEVLKAATKELSRLSGGDGKAWAFEDEQARKQKNTA
jgi:hypothetical protein